LTEALGIYTDLGGVLGIFMERQGNDSQVVDKLLDLILDLRNVARQDKDFARADSLRDLLLRLEVKVEDKPGGSLFRYEQPPEADELMQYLLQMRQELKAKQEYARADELRNKLQAAGIVLEDTREGARWKHADA